MEKSIKELNRIAREAAVDIYLSGGNGRLYWPYRLQPAEEGNSTPSVRESAHSYILDSGFKDGGVPKEQLISMAYERQPTYVIPNDTVNTDRVSMRQAIEETAEKVADFLDTIDEKSFPATVIIPLQPPHDFHYAYLHEHYPRQAQRGHFAIGGLKNATPEMQIQSMTHFRRVAGYEPYVHGFGFGAAPQILEALRENPALIDSVDFSTPQTHGMSAREAGHPRIPMRVGLVGGDDQASTAARRIEAEMCELARYLNPEKTDEHVKIHWEKYRKMWEKIGNRLEKEEIIQSYSVVEPRDDEQAAIAQFTDQEGDSIES